MMPALHALFSPSGADKWMQCHASLAAERGLPDKSSPYAEFGTAVHALSAFCLDQGYAGIGIDPTTLLGKTLCLDEDGDEVVITRDMVDMAKRYVSAVADTVEAFKLQGATSIEVFAEQQVDISHLTPRPNQFGTIDVLMMIGFPDNTYTLYVGDLKTGRKPVSVIGNRQLSIYALGALGLASPKRDITQVVLATHQPALHEAPEEWETTPEELSDFATKVSTATERVWALYNTPLESISVEDFTPSASACAWCKAKFTCEARRRAVFTAVADDFVDETKPLEPQISGYKERLMNSDDATLDSLYLVLPMISDFVDSAYERIHARLNEGAQLRNVKLVAGRKGNRDWADEEQVAKVLKQMRFKQDEIYNYKLISPTQAEKLLKDSPQRWEKLEELISRSEGKPTLAPASDKRPALVVKPLPDEFEDLTMGADLV